MQAVNILILHHQTSISQTGSNSVYKFLCSIKRRGHKKIPSIIAIFFKYTILDKLWNLFVCKCTWMTSCYRQSKSQSIKNMNIFIKTNEKSFHEKQKFYTTIKSTKQVDSVIYCWIKLIHATEIAPLKVCRRWHFVYMIWSL